MDFFFFFDSHAIISLTLWKLFFSLLLKKGELNLRDISPSGKSLPKVNPEPRLKLAEGGKRKTNSHIQGDSHKGIRWFFYRKFSGQKEVALYIQCTEKNKNNLQLRTIYEARFSFRMEGELKTSQTTMAKKKKRKSKIVSQYWTDSKRIAKGSSLCGGHF